MSNRTGREKETDTEGRNREGTQRTSGGDGTTAVPGADRPEVQDAAEQAGTAGAGGPAEPGQGEGFNAGQGGAVAGEEDNPGKRLEELSSRNAELLDSLVRLKAEFENYRKRVVREQTRLVETAESGLVARLLPVIDNLERALENAPDGDGAEGLRRGVEMVLSQILDLLGKEGLEAVVPEGEPFDPEHHEAMMVVETDECPEGTVLEVVQKGYRFGGSLLRPAMVKVSCPVKSE